MSRRLARRPSAVAVPLSTKIVSAFGIVLLLGGLGLAGWQKLTAGSEDVPAGAVGERASQLSPVAHNLPGVAALLVVTCVVGVFVLSRNKPPVR